MKADLDKYDEEPANARAFDALVVSAGRRIQPQRLEKRVAELIEQDALAKENAQLKRQLRNLSKRLSPCQGTCIYRNSVAL